MKAALISSIALSSLWAVNAFIAGRNTKSICTTRTAMKVLDGENVVAAPLVNHGTILTREALFQKTSGILLATASIGALWTEPALARGRATLEKSFQRYAPRIRAGGDFYQNDLRQLIQKKDWAGIKAALSEPPERKQEDLMKPDSGVAARARQAGGFSDARVLVAADLLASSFSDNSISVKTKKMQAAVAKLRDVVEEMKTTAKLALGEVKQGGFLGLGAKKVPEEELAKKIRELYVLGGNAWNEYIYALNDDLALQFDRFEFIK